MPVLETVRDYCEEYVLPMLEGQFPDLLPYIACGLCGSGSECFGFDDEVSPDHDVGPDVCLFLPGEDVISRRDAFLLERAYAKLPKEYRGLRRPLLSPVGGSRRGVLRTADFFLEKTGTPDGMLSVGQWLDVPQESLAEAVNGEIFFDHYGEITKIRRQLAFYPEDIMKKKLAGQLLLAGQAGQYNYGRCLAHGESAAAQLAVFEFVKAASAVIFLLNGRYRPYYKWSFRALRQLPLLSLEAELFEYLMTSGNDEEAEEKQAVIEGIAADIIDCLKERGLSAAVCGDLEKHAYSVNDTIRGSGIRSLHILAAV